jgi:hypothetical protein
MATTIEAIEADIAAASVPGFRLRLIARGRARAMIWRDGALPPGAPAFSDLLSYDLQSYGYAMLGLGLRLRDLGGDVDRARVAFQQAATALEAVIANGDPANPDRDFHHVMAAAAYHLGRFSARAYSLLVPVPPARHHSRLFSPDCLDNAYFPCWIARCKQLLASGAIHITLFLFCKSGAGEGIRTPDPNLGKVLFFGTPEYPTVVHHIRFFPRARYSNSSRDSGTGWRSIIFFWASRRAARRWRYRP